MKLPDHLRKNCAQREAPLLAELTTAGVGGRARCLLEPADTEALAAVIGFLEASGLGYRILGAGSNILASDRGVSEVLVGTQRLDEIAVLDANVALIRAGAGTLLPRLVSFCAASGFQGAECLAGIPGTVGGAAVMNAGGRYGQIGSIVETVAVVARDGTVRELAAAQCGFGYRSSALRGMTVACAVLRLAPADAAAVRRRTATVLAEKRRTQPLNMRSCGCVFKNPPGCHAGRMLDDAGLKGYARGGARISSRHAAFFVNENAATCGDFEALITKAQCEIRRIYGIELELEVDVWS